MIIGWWSAGITSAVACKLAIENYGSDNVALFYFDTGAAHPDNDRFKKECEEWYGCQIHTRKSKKYDNPLHVIRKNRYVNGPNGARCTLELKKQVRYDIEKEIKYTGQVFGFEFSTKEINRAIRFKEQYPDAKPLFPLIDKRMTKNNCAFFIEQAGIQLPKMYELGYPNNNCIGCVKGGQGYWNKIRTDFPDVFEQFVEVEHEIGRTCLKKDSKPLFLSELDPNAGRQSKIVMPDCGSFCDLEFTEILDPRVEKILNGQLTLEF